MKRCLTILFTFTLVIGLGCLNQDQPVSKSKPDPNAQLAATLHQQGVRLYEEGKYQEAVTAWLQENELTPNKANVNNNIGMAYRKLGDLKTAMEYHKKALELDPKYGHAHYSMGLVYYDLKNYEEAASAFQRAADLNYYDPDVYYSLAVTFLNLKDYQKTKAFWEKVIKLNPSYRNVQYKLKEVNLLIMKESNLTTAEDFFKLGMSHVDMGQYSYVAADAFKKAIEIDPSYPDAHYRLGYVYEMLKKDDLAMQEYEKELEFHPSSENAIKRIYHYKGTRLEMINPLQVFSEHSAFQGIDFPTKGIVMSEKAVLYATDLYHKGRELHKGEKVAIVGLFDKKLDTNYKNDFFYILEGEKELLNTRDVILESRYENPTYVSPQKRFRVIRNPVSHDEFDLWLHLENKIFVHLATVGFNSAIGLDRDYYSYGISLKGVSYDFVGKYIPVSWSPDERYLFVQLTGDVFTPEGRSMRFSREAYASPVWHGDLLFLRGTGENDAVYTFNLNSREFKKFLDIPDGERKSGDRRAGGLTTWPGVEIKGNSMKVIFQRYNQETKNIDEGCMDVEVIADMAGKIIQKKKNILVCDDEY